MGFAISGVCDTLGPLTFIRGKCETSLTFGYLIGSSGVIDEHSWVHITGKV